MNWGLFLWRLLRLGLLPLLLLEDLQHRLAGGPGDLQDDQRRLGGAAKGPDQPVDRLGGILRHRFPLALANASAVGCTPLPPQRRGEAN